MYNRYYLIVVILLTSNLSTSQSWNSIRLLSGSGTISSYEVEKGLSNTVWVGATFSQSLSLNAQNITSIGQNDILLINYDQSGNVINFKTGGSADNDAINDLVVSPSGELYLCGRFRNQFTWGSTQLTASGNGLFILKLDSNADLIWAKKIEGSGVKDVNSLSVDGNGNLWVSGYFQSDLNTEGLALTANGLNDIFVAKYDASGSLLWLQGDGGSGTSRAHAIVTDQFGNAYLTGQFTDSLQLGGDQLVASVIYTDVFLAKCDENGQWLWAKKIGGVYNDRGDHLQVSTSGRVFIAGTFFGILDFGNLQLASYGYHEEAYLAAFSPSGSFIWAKQQHGSDDKSTSGLTLDDNQLIFTANFKNVLWVNNDTITTNGDVDTYFQIRDESGNLLQTQVIQGSGDDLSFDGVKTDQGFVLVGSFQQDINFGNIQENAIAGYDGFIATWEDPFLAIKPLKSIGFKLQPNPAKTQTRILLENNVLLSWELTDPSGRLLIKGRTPIVRLDSLTPATYYLRVYTEEGAFTTPLVVQ